MPKGIWISTIKPLFNRKAHTSLQGSSLILSSDGKIIASASCIDFTQTSIIKKGFDEFSSLTAHKLFRWQIRIGFENWIQQKVDPRLICTTGGYEGIAKLIGCGNSHKAISVVKSLLHAQAYARFSFYDGSQGNMIVLREVERHKNGESSKINIILGELLLPNYTQLLPKGEKRRLIPIPELPQMIGSNNTHAAQAFLQLLILEEFAEQSKDVIERGYVYLPKEKWMEFANEASMPKSSLARVIHGWIEQGFLKTDFVNREPDAYILGERYFQLADFLYAQGEMRKRGEKAGEKSSALRKTYKRKSNALKSKFYVI